MNRFFVLQTSKIHLQLAVLIYGLAFLSAILYLPWLSMLLVIIVLSIGAWRFFADILGKNSGANRITALRLNPDNMIIYYQNGNQQSQAYQGLYFQSRYLLVLPIKCYAKWQQQSSLVIFSDSLKGTKISELNRLLTVYQ